MSKIQLPGEKEIREAYQQGEEAVISLFQRTILILAERIRKLEDQLAKTAATAESRHPAMDTTTPRRAALENVQTEKAEDRRDIGARR